MRKVEICIILLKTNIVHFNTSKGVYKKIGYQGAIVVLLTIIWTNDVFTSQVAPNSRSKWLHWLLSVSWRVGFLSPKYGNFANKHIQQDVFEDRIFSPRADVVWPPRSCDLTPLDYYLWGALKEKPKIIDALKYNIHEAIGEIQPHTIDNVLKNWTDRVGYCIASRSSHLNEKLKRRILTTYRTALRAHSLSYTRCFAHCFWRSHYQP